jgi:signal transduction histidine kinase/ligand-binding sensor domain-containing protein/DNA-binding response OmpR family regulator
MNKRLRIFQLLLLLVVSRLAGQTLRPPPLHLERVGSDLGLSQNLITCIMQDRQGFLWFGTKDGLNKFDGYTFTVYRHDPYDATTLSNNFVTALYEDRAGRIWVGTHNGLNLFDRATEIFHRSLPDSAKLNRISHYLITGIAEDARESGALWIATAGGGLNKLTLPAEAKNLAAAKFTHLRHDPNDPHSLSRDWVSHLAIDSRGAIWVSSDFSIDRIIHTLPNHFEVSRFTPNPPDPSWKKMLQGSPQRCYLGAGQNGTVWIGTGAGLIRWDAGGAEFTYFKFALERYTEFSWNNVVGMYEDRQGVIWIGTYDGFARFDPSGKQFSFYRHEAGNPNSVPESGIGAFLQDEAGVLWLGSNGNGLFRQDPQARRFAQQHQDGRLSVWQGTSLRALCEIRAPGREEIWAGAANGKLYRINRFTGETATVPAPLPIPTWGVATSILQDRTGALWIGTAYGLFRLEWRNARATPVIYFNPNKNSEPALSQEVCKILEDRDGEIWSVTLADLFRWKRGTNEFARYQYAPPDPAVIVQNKFVTIHQDRRGALWLGTSRGLLRFERETGTFTTFATDVKNVSSLSHNIVRAICDDPLDPENVLWIGTAGGGLNRFDMRTQSFTHFTIKHGLPDMVIYAILNDRSGNLWMSTNHGLSRFHPRTRVFKNFDAGDGLQDNEFNAGSYFKSASGELFFGGINGFNAFYPEDIRDNPHAPPVVFTDFLLFNLPVSFRDKNSPLAAPINETKELTLAYDQNVFSFEFAALDYTDPAKNRYRYRMENFDAAWREAGASRIATYTNLNPGKYVFRVQGSNNDGVWNEEGASINIIITPPWWQTWWAYTLYVLFSTAILYGLRRYEMNRQQLKHQVEVERLQAEKKNWEAARLQALDQMKSRFFANISHEFRTPLTLIMGQLDSVRAALAEMPLKARLDMAFRNAQQLLRLINQVLDLAKLEAGRMELRAVYDDIVPLLKSLTHTFEALAQKKRIALRFQCSDEHFKMYYEPDKIEKIMHNLLSNAFKFTPEGGSVLVRVEMPGAIGEGRSAPFALHPAPETFLQITVKDTGIGIPKEHLPHIFDRFHQVDSSTTREHEGTGIGLALTKELVELHGGEISVESEEGFGATFVVRLPLDKERGEKGELEPATSDVQPEISDQRPASGVVHRETNDQQPASSLQELVLIVEDNDDLRAYLREHLQERFQIIEAADGEEALAKALEQVPDLVITDLMMPNLDGYALCRKLRADENASHIPIIMLTARAEEADKIAGLEIGVDDYLTKPFSPNELRVRVRNLIELRKRLRARFSRTTLITPAEITAAPLDQKFLARIKEIVEANMENETFDLPTLSAKAGMSERQLERKLKALIDQTPNQFIRAMRLQRARQLLEQNAGTVSEIAYMVGFNNIPYFSKAFREAFGKPPSEVKGGE